MEKIDFFMSVSESNNEVELRLVRSGKSILKFINEKPPAVKVMGFKQPRLSEESLLEFGLREANDYPDGQYGALKHYINCRDKEVYEHTLELRKIMRKLIMATESANVANKLLKKIEKS